MSYRYNAFGNKLGMLDAMGWLTRYTYDAANRLTSTIHAGTDVTYIDDNYNLQSAGWQNVTERYYYDQAGRLTMQIDGAGAATRYAYDMCGNLLSTTQPMGQLTRSAYDALNHKIAEVDPNNMASTWSYNYFGKVTHHTDIGGAVYSYAYDNAQQLIAQSNTRGQSLNYYYDAAGQVTQVNDNALGQVTTYAYDLAGNRVREKTTQGGVVYQDNFLAYDALNRLRDVADGQVHISFQYDAVGNRTYIEQHSVDGNNRSDAGRYFRYDAMNRQTIVDGVDPYGNLGAQGHAITYDLNGNRTSDRYYGNKVVTAGGESVIIGYQESGEAIYGTTPTSFVRTQGVVEELYRYDNLGRLTSVVRDGVQIDHRYYDGAGRVMVSGASNLPVDYVTKLNEGVPQDQTNGMELRINQYDANGRLLHQRTLKSNGALKSDVNYDTYDAAGNVLNYSLTDYDGGYTNWYAYSMQRFEGYKQGTVSGTSNKMNPGSTTSNYDVNGNLVSVTDSTKPANNRTFVNDLAGHVLQVNQGGNINRQLVVNGEVLGQHGVGINPVTPKDGQGNPNFSYNADYDFGYQPIVANYPNAAPGSYTVQTGDSLQSIARSAYGDSALWYRIAEANGLSSDRDLRVGQTLNIPNKATGIHNDSGVFKPYDSSKVVGDTTPNLPMPSAGGGGGCGMLGSIIVAVVTIVVAVISQQYYLANGVVAGGGAGAGTAAAAGATTAAGATAAGTTAVTYTAGSMAMAGAVGGVAGAVAGQVVGMALGIQNGFDWKAVALGAIGGGVAGGLSGVNVVSSAIGNAAIRGALTSAVTQGIGVATGLQKSFNWKGVVGSAVGAAVGAGVNEALGDRLGVDTAGRFAKGAVTAFSAGVSTAAARGGRIDVTTIAADAFGNALGSSLASQSSSANRSQGEDVLGEKIAELQKSPVWNDPVPQGAAWDGTLYGTPGTPSYGDGTPVRGVFAGPSYNDQSHTVGRGDTVEALARAAYGDDWRAGVAAIINRNNLSANAPGSPILRTGNDVVIPDLQRYQDQGVSLDTLSNLGGGVIAGNQRGIDAYNAWQAKQAQAAAAAQAATSGSAEACTPNNPLGIAAPRTPEEAAALIRSGVLGSVSPLGSGAVASVSAYTPTLREQIVDGVANVIGGRAGNVLAGATQSWLYFGDNLMSGVANLPSAISNLPSAVGSMIDDPLGTIGAGVGKLQQGFQRAVYGDGRAMGSLLFNVGTAPLLGEAGAAGWEATAGARSLAGAGLRAGAEAFGPTVDAMAGRYPMVFGPRFGIVERGVGNLAVETAAVRGPTGDFYSVAFEMKLSPTSYPGVSRGAHFREANEALLQAIKGDAGFAQDAQSLGINVQRTPTGLAPRTSPNDWTWHHAEDPGVMQLVPRAQHQPSSIFQGALHPNGQGGYSIWGKE